MAESPASIDLSFIFAKNIYGDVAVALTLLTNIIATSLIGYKAWHVILMLIHKVY